MKMKRHQWKYGTGFEKDSRYCIECRLSEVVKTYRYRSPCYGYKLGKRRTWYFKRKVVGDGNTIPFGCGDLPPAFGVVLDGRHIVYRCRAREDAQAWIDEKSDWYRANFYATVQEVWKDKREAQ